MRNNVGLHSWYSSPEIWISDLPKYPALLILMPYLVIELGSCQMKYTVVGKIAFTSQYLIIILVLLMLMLRQVLKDQVIIFEKQYELFIQRLIRWRRAWKDGERNTSGLQFRSRTKRIACILKQ